MFLIAGDFIINTVNITSLQFRQDDGDGQSRLNINTTGGCRQPEIILTGNDAIATHRYVCTLMSREVCAAQDARVENNASDLPAEDEEELFHAQTCGCGRPLKRCNVVPEDLADSGPPFDPPYVPPQIGLADMDEEMALMWDGLEDPDLTAELP